VEPFYNGHRWGPKFCPLSRGVPNRGFQFISGRRGMRNRATWLRFQSFPLLYAGRECYKEASTTSNSANLMSSC